MNKRNEKAITLIALIVTIVVLLILAGVSISMLTGENGIITQAKEAKENTRGGEVKEYVELAANENKMVDYTTGTKKEKQDVIDELVADKKLTDKEVELLKTTDEIIIGNVVIDFSILGESAERTTIGDVYTEEMIGKTINYTSDTELPEGTEWIILGEDKDGSIMLTTSKPISGFGLDPCSEKWLSYEEDIKEVCSIYGATVQGKEVKARSITLEDVNRVTGFIEPEFNTYTFGSTLDYENKKVDYYHPDATSDNFWSKKETTYENNAYCYSIDSSDNTIKYSHIETNWKRENYTTSTLKNMDIIVGENLDYTYFLGSRSVEIDERSARFYVASVGMGYIGREYNFACGSESDRFSGGYNSLWFPVRPIINLPSDIEVEEVDGEWSIVVSSSGDGVEEQIDWEEIISSISSKYDKYLAQAQIVKGQITEKNIGIGTDGKVVNLDLWHYYPTDDGKGMSIGKDDVSSERVGYDKENLTDDGKIQGKMPQYIYIKEKDEVYPVTLLDNMFYTGAWDQAACELSEMPEIPNTVVSIGRRAFYKCVNLKNIIIPGSVKTIGYNAFEECTGLTSVTIQEGVTSIGDYAFYHCTGLTNIEIPESVTSIGDYAFQDCTGLTRIEIPESVTNIGYYAFYGCTNLSEVYFKQATAPTFGNKCFYKSSNLKTTFYFKNDIVYNAFTESYYNSQYGEKSKNYNW